jgi:hypothetical protein
VAAAEWKTLPAIYDGKVTNLIVGEWCFLISVVRRKTLASLVLSIISFVGVICAQAQSKPAPQPTPTVESVFAGAPFEKWQVDGPHQDLPWKVKMSADKLSFHQRLIALIQIDVPVSELLKRLHDEQITFLVAVRNGQGISARNYGLLDMANFKQEMKGSDVEFSWVAFAAPGQYEVSVAMWDKKSGEHNFMTHLFHVDAYKNDPLPEMWRGLDAFEFWSDSRDPVEYLFHPDIEGKLYLPLKTKRPIDLELLLDMTPSAEIYRGNVDYYNRYLLAAVPMFRTFSQIDVLNGSRRAAALDFVHKKIPFEQTGGNDLDWMKFSKILVPENSPGTVSVKELQDRKQSPVFLREEIVRRLNDPASQGRQRGEKPLHVFVLIGSPMDRYSFPQLPAIETGNEEDCLIYYLQFNFFERPVSAGGRRHRIYRFEGDDITGAVGNVEKMLKPLKVRTFQVHSADEVRHALAKVMEEVGAK